MQVLVVGSGGREHALAWGLLRSPVVDGVVVAPGNPGIAGLGPCMDLDDAMASLDVFDLAVIGPEAPLVDGLADDLRARGVPVFGPSAAAARLEGSKAWMKEILASAEVPTARHGTFTAAEEPAALAYLETLPGLYVVKTDGLAAGKGVLVTESLAEARDGVREYLAGRAFGDAGRTVVIEEGLTGPELSLLVFCDGSTTGVPLAPAQDFKRIGDGDSGPNTGGMGAYSPVPVATAAVVDEIMDRAVQPTLATLARHDIDYRGVLYAGLMLTPQGPKVIEYNVRFGDPECEVIVPRFASDLAVHCAEAATGRLETPIEFRDDACVTVVLASEGYPVEPRTGDVIDGLDAATALDDVIVFHAGTATRGEDIVTAGGRVLAVTALGPDVAAARARAYEAADLISWPGVSRRTDIAAAPTG
ncbi:MAG: phosphoribosylamine--glycine ligase [Acidimicrobiia bacterium]|nr:phosphoribosylamine--glycine ligase [Acidimicrobiia bacterium]